MKSTFRREGGCGRIVTTSHVVFVNRKLFGGESKYYYSMKLDLVVVVVITIVAVVVVITVRIAFVVQFQMSRCESVMKSKRKDVGRRIFRGKS